MATTNLLQWNPTQANQENDAAYAADPTRAGGAVDPTVFLSVLGNKAYYQWSTYLTALFTAFAAKGYTTSDSSLGTLTAQCANFVTTADLFSAVSVLAYSPTIALNAAKLNGFYFANMTGNLTISGVSGLGSGQLILMWYQQDATGGRTVSFPSLYVNAVQPDPAANAVSAQLFGYDSTTSKLRAVTPLMSDNGVFFANNIVVPALGTFGSLTLVSPGTAGQVLTNVGGIFVPRSLQATTIRNSNGTFVQTPDGAGGLLYEAWGAVTSASSGGTLQTQAITFPATFPGVPVLVLTLGTYPDGASPDAMTAYHVGVSTTGATAILRAAINIGGSGAGSLNAIPIHWHARY